MLPTDGRKFVNVTTNKTLAITDQGIVQNATVDGIVFTLPSTVVGYVYTIRNGGDNPAGTPAGAVDGGSALVTVSPAALDLIAGNSYTATDDKDAINTKATSRVGDEMSIVGNGTTGWNIIHVDGIWAREA